MEASAPVDSPSALVSCSQAEGLDVEMEDVVKMAIVQGNDVLKTTLETLRRLEERATSLQKAGEKEEGERDEDGSTPVSLSEAKEGILQEIASLRQNLDGVQALVQTTEASAASLATDLSALSEERDLLQRKNDEMRSQLSELGIESGGDLEALINHLQEQLSRGEAERRRMRTELDELRAWKSLDGKSADEVKLQVVKAETTLARLKESFLAVKADKKRLKSEKSDLLQQMKQLYAALQEKEADVKDFLTTYEARMREFEESVHHLQAEKEESEREKWEILRRARDSAERSVSLRTQLDMKETALQAAEDELARLKRQLSDAGVRSSPSAKSLPNGFANSTPSKRSSHEAVTPMHVPTPSDSEPDGLPPYSESWRGKSASISVGSGDYLSPQCPQNLHLRQYGRVSHRSSEPDLTCGFSDNREFRKSKRRGFGSLSKVFTRPGRLSGKRFDELSDDRSRHSSDQLSVDTSAPSLHGLTDEQLQERWRVLEEAKGQCMSRWRSAAVIAWMEVVLNMPQYARACQENIKSGRVLLGMSDTEVENALGMSNILHRRKLRLAIEAQRSPQLVRHPKAHEIDHIWVSTVWSRQVGLGQHAESLLVNLVDGAVLMSLTRKDMEKHLGIVRKFHQASMMYGIELLRRVQFDKQLATLSSQECFLHRKCVEQCSEMKEGQFKYINIIPSVLAERRAMCEDADTDPLVWTNQRFIKWAHSIDLVEYAENLRDSGVHGGIVVLEPSFGPEAMATALGIPSSRNMIRRHLADELTQLIGPARAALEVTAASEKSSKKKLVSSLGRSFLSENGDVKRRRSFKDSLGRAFGRRTKHDLEQANSISNISVAATTATPTIAAASMTLDLESTTV